jgi:hypothetical protein
MRDVGEGELAGDAGLRTTVAPACFSSSAIVVASASSPLTMMWRCIFSSVAQSPAAIEHAMTSGRFIWALCHPV